MPDPLAPPPSRHAGPAFEAHRALRERYTKEAAQHDALGVRLSFLRLTLFAIAVVCTGIGLSRAAFPYLVGGAAVFAAFAVAVIAHALVVQRRDRATTRKTIHERHLARMEGRTAGFPNGSELLAGDHPYASDLDVVGRGSIFERIAVTHTRRGAETLAQWLGAAADRDTILARQEAVRELAADVAVRQELEAAVLDTGADALDPRPFLELTQREPYVLSRPLLRVASVVLPLITLAIATVSGSVLPAAAWAVPVVLQALIVWRTGAAVAERYALLSARRRGSRRRSVR
jgi:hypothetical protein